MEGPVWGLIAFGNPGPEAWSAAARWAALLALSAWTAVDTYAFGQIMISQPLVAGWVAGAMLGDPGMGLGIGLLLQLVWIRDLPMGGRAAPAGGPAAVVGVMIAHAAAGGGGPSFALGRLAFPAASGLLLALCVALLVGEGGRHLLARRMRSRVAWVREAEEAAKAGRDTAWAYCRKGIGESAAYGVFLMLGGWALGALGLVVPLPGGGDARWIAYPVLGLGLGMALSLSRKRVGELGLAAALVLVWVLS